jgi:transcriptional regulator with XRE-family HTH domain
MKKKKKIYAAQRDRLITLLREARIEASLTQTEIASRIGKDQAYVSRYESGQRRLDILEVRETCQAVGIKFEEFARMLERALK